jgi:N-methylhydantoinase B/oxoprolinase/acetone carboxylase alpha subunit
MVDPITVEVIGNALSSIVEEMGEPLVRAASPYAPRRDHLEPTPAGGPKGQAPT